MKKLALVAVAAFLLLGISSAQNIPIEVFGGFSYYSLDLPANPGLGVATSTRLGLNGWDVSGSVGQVASPFCGRRCERAQREQLQQ